VDDSSRLLAAFLRARRELVTPAQAGIRDDGARRVPGLRREEVAMLAGISADYYLRLERGRDRNPSAQVLEAIARVLQLDEEHTAHLFSLVVEQPRVRRRPHKQAPPPPGTLTLLDALTQPAYIENRYFDVLASNTLMRAIDPRITAGANQLRDTFLDPEGRALYPDWASVMECLAANLRQAVGSDVDDPRFIELAGELTLASPHFRSLWARHEVRGQTGGIVRFDHPQVGAMALNRERLRISGTDDMMLVIFHASPHSDDVEKLGLLASASALTSPFQSAITPRV
jgi:transcriptional regulator with XRE-family HTH domain